jgi:hypothetical protein
MEEPTEKQDLAANLTQYAKIQYDVLRLKIIRQTATAGSGITASLIIITIVGLGFVILSFGLALFISSRLGSNYQGFLLTGCLYFLIAILLYVFRKPVIINPVRNNLIASLLEDMDKTKTS